MQIPGSAKVRPRARQAGFTLVWMSILLTVAALVMVSVLPGREAGDVNQKTLNNIAKLNKVEEAMRSFMAFNGRRPCPADGQYDVNSADFGIEASIAGTCTGGVAPNAPLGPDAGTGNIVGGTIPTKSLGLPDDYAFDEYGRRFTYVVDKRATSTGNCTALMNFPTNNGTGGVKIESSTGGTVLDNTMYAYISHGPDGHGAFPAQGASDPAHRINTGSTDQDENTNAGASNDGNMTYSTANFTNVKVMKDRTPTFDDLVYYRQDIKNTCCLGAKCIPLGFRIDGQAGNVNGLTVVGIGDINGDGIPDLVLRDEYNFSGGSLQASHAYIIFGTPTGWPTPPTGLNPTTLNGSNGFTIYSTEGICCQYTYSSIVTDLNKDGYADIILGEEFMGAGGVVTGEAIVVFGGGGAWPATVDVKNLAGYTQVNGTSGTIITAAGGGGGIFEASADDYCIPIGLETGDIDHDGYNDLVVSCEIGAYMVSPDDAGFVVYGKPSTGGAANNDWQHTATMDASTFDGTYGFQFYSSDSNQLPEGFTWGPHNGITGDFDHDGYSDIVLNNQHTQVNGDNGLSSDGNGAIFLIYGRSRADWTSAFTTLNGNAAVIDLEAELTAIPNRATEFYYSGCLCGSFLGPNLFIADLNGDTYPDVLVSGPYNYPTVIYGNLYPGRWPMAYNIYQIASGKGFYVSSTGLPAWAGANFGTAISAFDVNGDGKLDLLSSASAASPNSRDSAGAIFVAFQPSGGWTNVVQYGDFRWDGTDSFTIYGPVAHDLCNYYSYALPWAANVRPKDNGTDTTQDTVEILTSCQAIGENSYGSVYGLYENKKYFGGWVSSIDLLNLN